MQDYKKLANEVLGRINYIRQNPKTIIPELTEMSKKFKDKVYNDKLITEEGASAVLEAIEFLKAQNSIPPLKLHEALMNVAQNLADVLSETGGVEQKDKDGAGASERISKAVNWTGGMHECISFGDTTAKEIVNSMIISDGSPERGHRGVIFSTVYKYIGVGCKSHPTYKTVTVIDTIEALK